MCRRQSADQPGGDLDPPEDLSEHLHILFGLWGLLVRQVPGVGLRTVARMGDAGPIGCATCALTSVLP